VDSAASSWASICWISAWFSLVSCVRLAFFAWKAVSTGV
jgi:hypothetical protein